MTTPTHYLDFAATTPLRPVAREAWLKAQHDLTATPGNPSSLHAGGRAARRMLDDAREQIADLLGVNLHEVLFTSGATESDALAVAGTARAVRAVNPARSVVAVSALEHDAVAHQREVLEPAGFTWQVLPSSAQGITFIGELDAAHLSEHLAVVSVCTVCSEVGTIQPVAQLADIFGAAGNDPVRAARGQRPIIHTDAAQAFSCLPISMDTLGADLLSIGGHKVGAPVGTGILVARRGIPLTTDRPGGGHERGIRSGTPDVAGAVALAAAMVECVSERDQMHRHCSQMRREILDHLPEGVSATVGDAPTVPSIIHLSMPTAHPEVVLMAMDRAGMMVSAGSACHAGVTRPSEVVTAMGRSEREALGVLRVCVSTSTTLDDVRALCQALPDALSQAQAMDGFDERGHVVKEDR